mmetsp:Transcript_9836/g.22470  ORF Transcript_9836/g.22470 Transcript_9836/m.22470 type:complete len:207 (+) Transcript_9836:762-1382(+)
MLRLWQSVRYIPSGQSSHFLQSPLLAPSHPARYSPGGQVGQVWQVASILQEEANWPEEQGKQLRGRRSSCTRMLQLAAPTGARARSQAPVPGSEMLEKVAAGEEGATSSPCAAQSLGDGSLSRCRKIRQAPCPCTAVIERNQSLRSIVTFHMAKEREVGGASKRLSPSCRRGTRLEQSEPRKGKSHKQIPLLHSPCPWQADGQEEG